MHRRAWIIFYFRFIRCFPRREIGMFLLYCNWTSFLNKQEIPGSPIRREEHRHLPVINGRKILA
jgi:hypothetical protein